MAIECVNLAKFYGSFKAINNVSFKVEKGEIFGLLGLNGAGKTTILKILTGQILPSYGSAWIAGINIVERPLEAKRKMGYVPEVPYLYERLTGREFIELTGVLRGMEEEAVKKNLLRFAGVLEFEESLDGEIGSYSKGMRQKLALLAAVFHEPEVLILDEPNSGLDPLARKKVKTLLKSVAGEGRTVLLSTHITENAEEICDRIAVIDHGEIISLGTPAEITASTNQKSLEDAFDSLIKETNSKREKSLKKIPGEGKKPS